MVAILNVIYPVGSIIVYSKSETRSPKDIIGGEWILLNGGRILALDKTKSIGAIGGETDHILTVEEMPEHYHKLATNKVKSIKSGGSSNVLYLDGYGDYEFWRNTPPAGGGKSHENMPPYEVVRMWRRTK